MIDTNTISSLAADAEAFRQKVIDAGIRGKLTEQLPEDGTAQELFERIQKEKECLVKEGKIKKQKPLSPIKPEEIPFEIPENWMWVRFENISYIVRGGSPRPIKRYITNDPDGINWIKIGDVEKGGKYIYSAKEKIIPEGEKRSRHVYPGDFLLTNSMSFGRPYISRIEGCIHDGWLLVRNLGGFNVDYLYYLLSSGFLYDQFIEKASGSTVDNLNIEKVNSSLIPFPPLAEQQRIAKRIEEILSVQQDLQNLLESYTSDVSALKFKVIDAGIQGRLTEQLPEDGTAQELFEQIQEEKTRLVKKGKIKKQKPLPPIKPEEVPFEIPGNWMWVRLGDIFDHNTGKALNASDKEGSLLEYITTSNVYWDHFELNSLKSMYFRDDEIEKCTIKKGDLLICEGGDIGRSAIWPYEQEMRIQNHLHKLRSFKPEINVKYYFYMMWSYKNSGLINGRGIGLQGFSSKRVHSLIVPLPPLAEQQRIAERIEEILSVFFRSVNRRRDNYDFTSSKT